MPSVKNPNKASKNRLAAQNASARKAQQRRSAAGKTSRVAKSDAKRGARAGIAPTSGPRAPLSSKKQRKLERKLGYAVQRQKKANGEVDMKGKSHRKDATPSGAVRNADRPPACIDAPESTKETDQLAGGGRADGGG